MLLLQRATRLGKADFRAAIGAGNTNAPFWPQPASNAPAMTPASINATRSMLRAPTRVSDRTVPDARYTA